ncbi:MAG: hypothetical protein ACC628_16520, partial [Pirellulaceae bacterium]
MFDLLHSRLKTTTTLFIAFLIAGWYTLTPSAVIADDLRVGPPGKVPADRRLGELKDLNGYFPFLV